MEYLLLFFAVATAIAATGYLVPRACSDEDLFGGVSAALGVVLSVVGCCTFGWLVLTRRIMRTDVEAFFSFLLFGGFIWTAGFLLPAARRNHDVFGIVCAIVAALIALAAWLFLGTGVQSR
jgi:hypothetical protein